MTTYSTMIVRIVDETARSDLEAQIRYAIQDAIKHWEQTGFWFQEEKATTTTVASQTYYGLPSDFLHPKSAKITHGNSYHNLTLKTQDELENEDPGTAQLTGVPDWWGIERSQLRLFPTPNGVYTVTFLYIKSLSSLSADSDTNAWMTTAERLIRSAAKRILYQETIRDAEAADEAATAEAMAYQDLWSRHVKTVSTGRLRPDGY